MTSISCRLLCFCKVTKCYLFPSTALICLRHTGHLLRTAGDPLLSPRTLSQLPLSPRWVRALSLGLLSGVSLYSEMTVTNVITFCTLIMIYSQSLLAVFHRQLLSFMDSIFSYLSHSLPLWHMHHLSSSSYIRPHISAHMFVEYSVAVGDSE